MPTAKDDQHEWLGFSLKSIVIIFIGIIAIGLYIGVLLFGDSSLMVLNRLNSEEQELILEKKKIKESNQRLQKQYFELIQLTE